MMRMGSIRKSAAKKALAALFGSSLVLSGVAIMPVLAAGGAENGYAEPSGLIASNLLIGAAHAGSRLVAVGEFGHIILSDDNGATWRQARAVPTRATLTSVYFVDASTGWAAGHDTTVLKTTDGGETWTLQYDREISLLQPDPPPLAPPPVDSGVEDEFAEEDDGGLGSSAIMDAGAELYEMRPDTPVLTLVFADANTGVVAGAFGFAAITNDGGATWDKRRLSSAVDDDYHLNGAFTGPNGSLFIAGEAGYIYRSLDKGANWDLIATGYDGSLWGGMALSDGTLLAYGMRGNVWRSTDLGSTWTKAETSTPESLASGVELADGRIVMVGLGGTIIVSSDKGLTWSVTNRADRKGLSAVLEAAPGQIAVFGEMGVAVQAAGSGS
ncbi:MAG TPA: YCF48-related protein [Micropepsaceae bacterium]|nr:YCF48-related protein [Micropepsaceae bacterium]